MKGRLILKNSLILCLSLLLGQCAARPVASDTLSDPYQLLATIPLQAKSMATDRLNQLYLVTMRNEVIKYNQQGQALFNFSNNQLGPLERLDMTDPFHPLLYYPDYLTLITLDRTMNKTGEFDLTNLGLLGLEAVGLSNDNNIWVYDELVFRLRKIDRQSRVLLESEDLNMRLGSPPQVQFLIERANQVFLHDAERGILVFDLFGQYQYTLEIQPEGPFQVLDERLIFHKEGKLLAYDLRSLSGQRIPLPEGVSPDDDIRLERGALYVRKADRVEIYHYQVATTEEK